jgi:hypothetical protein
MTDDEQDKLLAAFPLPATSFNLLASYDGAAFTCHVRRLSNDSLVRWCLGQGLLHVVPHSGENYRRVEGTALLALVRPRLKAYVSAVRALEETEVRQESK